MSPANVDNLFRSFAALCRNTFAQPLQTFFSGAAALGIGSGGTGATDAATALSNLGALSTDYRDLKAIVKNTSFTFADSERGCGIGWGGGSGTATINPQSSTPITVGATYVIRNGAPGVLTIARGAGVTLQVNGSTTSSNASLAFCGVATVIYWGGDVWSVTGAGVS